MKTNQYFLIACTIALSACASTVRLDDLPPVVDHRVAGQGLGNTTNVIGNQGSGESSVNNGLSIKTPNLIPTVDASTDNKVQPDLGMLAKRSIYFDYDSFGIRDDARPILQAHAKHLSNNRNTKIALEGNTDERGGSEYNLALGQKRANAVQEALQLMGVYATQMEAVSFGKEKPKATGSDEAGYAENRRTDIQYK
jgi:peptidoglycan-associated lipoprotein